MDSISILLVVATMGVNFGWQPDPHDPQAYEVVVQLEPQLVDAMRDGQAVSIESHIPPNVHPIRKVRVVVGTGDLARTPLAATAKQPAELRPTIVRGQDSGLLGNRYGDTSTVNNRQYDQLGATIGNDPSRSVQPPPPLGQVQNARAETGDTLRSGIESGIQKANEQLGRAGEQAPPPDWAAVWGSSPASDQAVTDQLRGSSSADPAENDKATSPPTGRIARSSQLAPETPSGNSDSVAINNPPFIDFASSPAESEAAAPAKELPWLPLLGTSIGLVASLAANLFLGWSYADARQKYRALVRKTTHAFQKSAGVAA